MLAVDLCGLERRVSSGQSCEIVELAVLVFDLSLRAVEVVDDFDGATFRAVYTVKLKGVVYVLHAFQKKSKKGSETPKAEMDLVKARLKLAEADHAQRQKEKSDEKK